ncbi:hypothetical protein BY458DRAFT_531336 [Sporodiniella umbellata]|nr:hypothetical protein BY458DRAFT_531336 [Sporodiniella umbellata]
MPTSEICSTSFNNRGSLKTHQRDQHSLSARLTLSSGETVTIFRESNSRFRCFCGSFFETVRGLESHYVKKSCTAREDLNSSQVESPSLSTSLTSSSSGVRLLMESSYNVFESSYEINAESDLETTSLPENILTLIQEMNKSDIREVKKVLLNYAKIRYSGDFSEEGFHIDKLCYARNPNPLLMQQQEQWYNSNIWVPVINKFLGNIDGINCIRENKSSLSSRKRKREVQEKNERKKIGRKPDMIICAVGEGSKPLEFGACEAASFYYGTTGKKYNYELRLKLPKILKDMLYNLCEHGYTYCLNRSKSYEIGSDLNCFVKTLEVLTISLIMKLRLERSIKLIKNPTKDTSSFEFKKPSTPTLPVSMPSP